MKKSLAGLFLIFLFAGCATVPPDSRKELIEYIPSNAHILFSFNAGENQPLIGQVVKRINLTDKRISMLLGMVEHVLLGISDPGDGSMTVTIALSGAFPASILESSFRKQKQLTEVSPGRFETKDGSASLKIVKPYLLVVDIAAGRNPDRGISVDLVNPDDDFSALISDFNKIAGLGGGTAGGSAVKLPIQALSLNGNRFEENRYTIQCSIDFSDARSARLFRGLLKGVVSNYLISYAGDAGRTASREMKFTNEENKVLISSLNLDTGTLSTVLISIIVQFKGQM